MNLVVTMLRIAHWKEFISIKPSICGFVLALGAGLLVGSMRKGGTDHASVAAGAGSIRSVHRDAGGARLKEALGRGFLTQRDWADLLSGVSREELLQIIDQRDGKFWRTKPLGESAAYHLFGALARFEAGTAMAKAIETFAAAEGGEQKLEAAANEKDRWAPPFVLRNVERDSRISCLRWAVLGTFENAKPLQIEGYFDRCPAAYWRGLIQGAIAGSEGGSVAEDMRFYKALLANRLHFSDAEPAKQTKGAVAKGKNTALKETYDLLLRSAFDAWTERDPRAVLAWLQTDDGKAWNYTLPRVLAVCGLGSVEGFAQVAHDPRYAFTAENLADACYQSGWDAAAIRQYVDSLPAGQGNLFSPLRQAIGQGFSARRIRFRGQRRSEPLNPGDGQGAGAGNLPNGPAPFRKAHRAIDSR